MPSTVQWKTNFPSIILRTVPCKVTLSRVYFQRSTVQCYSSPFRFLWSRASIHKTDTALRDENSHVILRWSDDRLRFIIEILIAMRRCLPNPPTHPPHPHPHPHPPPSCPTLMPHPSTHPLPTHHQPHPHPHQSHPQPPHRHPHPHQPPHRHPHPHPTATPTPTNHPTATPTPRVPSVISWCTNLVGYSHVLLVCSTCRIVTFFPIMYPSHCCLDGSLCRNHIRVVYCIRNDMSHLIVF